MSTSDIYPLYTWVIDWSKITCWEHLKELLQCCDMYVKPEHPNFEQNKHLYKLIDRDGRQVDPETLLYMTEDTKSTTQGVKTMRCSSWDSMVESVYRKPYRFERQEGFPEVAARKLLRSLPGANPPACFLTLEVPGDSKDFPGVTDFDSWVATPSDIDPVSWWTACYYPGMQELANDLHYKGILETGTYRIIIDW